jgi:6-pyruvoyltetrahydropterin/6-carboxytetrahydropterin synthase
VTLARRFRFDAAHRLPHHPGRCRHLHGHGYEMEVLCRGPIHPATGMLVDFADLEAEVEERVLRLVDHTDLNRLLENPTAENLVVWIWERLAEGDLPVVEIRLHETPTCSVVYRGEHAAP